MQALAKGESMNTRSDAPSDCVNMQHDISRLDPR